MAIYEIMRLAGQKKQNFFFFLEKAKVAIWVLNEHLFFFFFFLAQAREHLKSK